jgi:hypothetical protein
MVDWPKVELPGRKFLVPRVCPNCMGPATTEWTATYTKGRLGGVDHYSMPFYYCDACSDMFREVRKVDKQIASIGHNLMAGWLLLGMLSIILLPIALVGPPDNFKAPVALLTTLIVAALAFYMTRHFRRKRQRLWETTKPRLPPNAAGYGFAAFCLKSKGVFRKSTTFTAARQEWLDLLVKENSGGQPSSTD